VTAVQRWWFSPVPVRRVVALRVVVYLFVALDVLWWTRWAGDHRVVPAELYRPLLVGRLLPLPVPTPDLVNGLRVALPVAALLAATGRAPRLAGAAVFGLYAQWLVVAMSYGKVDHDRFAFLVALAVLPTVGRARWADRGETEAAGWAVRCVQVAVVATYFLAAWAKLRFGGLEWVNGSTLTWAVTRRGTALADPLLHVPWLLQATQWGIVALELGSPLVFVLPDRLRAGYLWLLVGFHLVTFATITILFLPHVVCLLAFAPLERLGRAAPDLGSSRKRPQPDARYP
jgi:hypothetical protein